MKPFDIEAAKRGEPVVTRDGRPARVICFDRQGANASLVALIRDQGIELTREYTEMGTCYFFDDSPWDLFMASKKKFTKWMPIFEDGVHGCLYENPEDAASVGAPVAKVEWEE